MVVVEVVDVVLLRSIQKVVKDERNRMVYNGERVARVGTTILVQNVGVCFVLGSEPHPGGGGRAARDTKEASDGAVPGGRFVVVPGGGPRLRWYFRNLQRILVGFYILLI